MTDFEVAIGQALSLISAANLNDFGKYPKTDDGLREMAKAYSIAIIEDPRLTVEIIEQTAKRYIQGKVTVFKNDNHVCPEEFPSAPQFRDACVQTWHAFYRIVEVGQRQIEGGYMTSTTIIVRKSLPATEVVRAIGAERKRLGIPEALPPSKPTKDTPTLAKVDRKFGMTGARSEQDPEKRKDFLRKQARSM